MPALQASTSHPYSLLRRESKPPMTALYRTVLSLGALSLLCASCPAHADTFFGTDTTVNFAVSGNAILGFASQTDFTNGTNPSSPTVGFAAGGSVTTTSTTTLYTNTSGTPTINFVNAVSTPEPSVYALLAALGVPGVLALRRRRTRKRNLPFRRNYYGPQHLSLCAEEASPNAVFAPPGRHSS